MWPHSTEQHSFEYIHSVLIPVCSFRRWVYSDLKASTGLCRTMPGTWVTLPLLSFWRPHKVRGSRGDEPYHVCAPPEITAQGARGPGGPGSITPQAGWHHDQLQKPGRLPLCIEYEHESRSPGAAFHWGPPPLLLAPSTGFMVPESWVTFLQHIF